MSTYGRVLKVFAECNGKSCRVTFSQHGAGVVVFYLFVGAQLIAEHKSARWLSDSALESGAREVRFDFDLKIIERGVHRERR